MLTVIVTALVETLTKHMFQKTLDSMDEVDIGGAPSWYMVELDDDMCTFAHSKGGLNSIEIAKSNSKIKMIKKINGVIDVVVYDTLPNYKSPKEKQIINKWKKDPNLNTFVLQNLHYSKVVYEDEIDTSFVRGCIAKKDIISYQKDRLKLIKQKITQAKANDAFSELDRDTNGKSGNSNDPFSELP